jgi:hypothetical protein
MWRAFLRLSRSPGEDRHSTRMALSKGPISRGHYKAPGGTQRTPGQSEGTATAIRQCHISAAGGGDMGHSTQIIGAAWILQKDQD